MDKYELEKIREMLDRNYNNDDVWTERYRRKKWEYNYPDIPDWVDEVVQKKKSPPVKPKATQKVKPQPPKRKSIKKSANVGGALAQTLNGIDA